jgi:hypothetical protein
MATHFVACLIALASTLFDEVLDALASSEERAMLVAELLQLLDGSLRDRPRQVEWDRNEPGCLVGRRRRSRPARVELAADMGPARHADHRRTATEPVVVGEGV